MDEKYAKRIIPFSPPDISELEIAEVADALRSGWITTGPRTKKLEKRLAAYIETGKTDIDKVIINDMDFEAAYNDAIQAKSIAAQEQAKAEIVNQTAIARAEADKQVAVKKAEAEAETLRIAAEAEAEKVRIAAEAEAEANRKLSESLTDELIELKKVEAWDGRLPSVYGGNALLELGIDTAE